MMDVILIHPTPEGSEEIALESDSLSFGRGSEADYRFDDDGLSRLHTTIYRDGDNLWVVDENSTNGTFVNGDRVEGRGTPLENGDTIRIGNYTDLKVRLAERQTASETVSENRQTQSVSATAAAPIGLSTLLPIAIIAVALFAISISAAFIVFKYINKNQPEVANRNTNNDEENSDDEDNSSDETPTKTKTPKVENSPKNTSTGNDDSNLTNSPEPQNTPTPIILPSGKKYLEMSDAEKRQFIESRAQKVAAMIGNQASGQIPALAIDKIKGFVDAYAKRVNVAKMGGCRFGDNLQATYERASKNAPFIIHAFNQEGIDPQIGMYLAMIESEHCVCLQSPTGPLGMFQFTKATGEAYGLSVFKGASPSNPDERCKPEPSARAAGKYMKFLTGRYGTGPSSVPLAIGSYNSGEGGLSTNLKTALESNEGLPRDFWSLIANGDKLSKQFQAENFKYVPKFFAAAIIGENPKDFGLSLQPLSTYTK